jgi:hypothetical protein
LEVSSKGADILLFEALELTLLVLGLEVLFAFFAVAFLVAFLTLFTADEELVSASTYT